MITNRWITLPISWKLQDVQAALNVVIAFLCAACVFVLVRQFWIIAARQVTKKKDVPAYALLSLNTIGETVDVVWLLRHELLTRRYRGLLIQVIFVLLLTVCTFMSGFIARFATRNAPTIVPRMIEGSLAARDTDSLLYDSLDIHAIVEGLRDAHVPTTKLLEYWPDPNSNWQYNDNQWNSSWTMECHYNESIPLQNPRIVTNNCTNGLWEQFPMMYDNWLDWQSNRSLYWWNAYYDWLGWMVEPSEYRDLIMFVHGSQVRHHKDDGDRNITYDMSMRTVAIQLHNVQRNGTDGAPCDLIEAAIQSGSYTSATCDLKRDLGQRSGEDLDYWGASPDYGDLQRVSQSYMAEYASRLRRESDAGKQLTKITGPELVTFYQAYLLSKDTSGSLFYNTSSKGKPRVQRTIDVEVMAAQVSLTAVVVCSVTLGLVLLGLLNYWVFVLLNLRRLDEAPQSKLDWMLQTLRRDDTKGGKSKPRHKLRTSLSGEVHGDAVPLTKLDEHDMYRPKSAATMASSAHASETNVSFNNTPATVATDFTGQTLTPHARWPTSPPQQQYPQYQYQRDGFSGLGIMNRHGYDRVPFTTEPYASPYAAQHTSPYFDTAYDPGKRWGS